MDKAFVVQSLSRVWVFETPWTIARQTPLSSTVSWSLLKFMSIESVMLSNHLILHCLLLFFYFPSFLASGSFVISRLFTSSGQSIGASARSLGNQYLEGNDLGCITRGPCSCSSQTRTPYLPSFPRALACLSGRQLVEKAWRIREESELRLRFSSAPHSLEVGPGQHFFS